MSRRDSRSKVTSSLLFSYADLFIFAFVDAYIEFFQEWC